MKTRAGQPVETRISTQRRGDEKAQKAGAPEMF